MYEHGGDIYRNKVNIDFSVNVSPYGMPPAVRAAFMKSFLDVGTYPDATYESVRKAIGKMEGVSADSIVCGNGASELIYAVFRAISRTALANNEFSFAEKNAKKLSVGLVEPCFSEYRKAAMAAGISDIEELVLDRENGFELSFESLLELLGKVDCLILGNPNNPTGRLIPVERLKELIDIASASGGKKFLILDESFLPLTEDSDEYSYLRSEYLIRIKSFTKSMAVAGIRAGYVICENKNIRENILEQLPEWNMSVPASYVSEASCLSKEWLLEKVCDEKTGLRCEREFLAEKLSEAGVKVYESDTNFLLIYDEMPLYDLLLDKGILIRDCSNFKGLSDGFYRIAVKNREDNGLLIKAINEIKGRNMSADSEAWLEECVNKNSEPLIHVLPKDIEATSFKILTSELKAKGINPEGDTAPVIKRCIHTTADFEYVNTLCFSENAVNVAKELIRHGANIVTDTNMALAGINKKEVEKYGGQTLCFMADPKIAELAKERGTTRASVSMEYAAGLSKKTIFVVGNAPTALVTLCEMIDSGKFIPDFVIGVPVGFVNVEQAKEMIISRNIPFIVNRGRKGGSNVAAAIVNAILYEMREENNG